MAKLKTRTNQPVVDSEGLLDHIAQEGRVTQIGGDLEVDGEILFDLEGMHDFLSLLNATDVYPDLDFGTWYTTPYTYQQVLSIINKYYLKGLTHGDLGPLQIVSFIKNPKKAPSIDEIDIHNDTSFLTIQVFSHSLSNYEYDYATLFKLYVYENDKVAIGLTEI